MSLVWKQLTTTKCLQIFYIGMTTTLREKNVRYSPLHMFSPIISLYSYIRRWTIINMILVKYSLFYNWVKINHESSLQWCSRRVIIKLLVFLGNSILINLFVLYDEFVFPRKFTRYFAIYLGQPIFFVNAFSYAYVFL